MPEYVLMGLLLWGEEKSLFVTGVSTRLFLTRKESRHFFYVFLPMHMIISTLLIKGELLDHQALLFTDGETEWPGRGAT